MRAVLMAGGSGTRLRPLTYDIPKPMVPILNRPIAEHILNLLRKHHIREVIVTLHFLPDVLREYFQDGGDFGMEMTYAVEEDQPLGTTGCVKNTAELLDDTFIVISGDSLTDFNLTAAIGDVLQFLDRREEALEHYNQALRFYRDVGESPAERSSDQRLGEANTLIKLGGLQSDLTESLAYFQQAQELYLQINDRYSQGRNLVWYIAPTQAKLGHIDLALAGYQEAAEIGEAINFLPFKERALEQLQALRDKLKETPPQ